MSGKYSDLVRAALMEIRVASAGDAPPPEDMDLGLYRAQLILGSWNITPAARFDITHQSFTITPSLDPHTIGLSTNTPAPTWAVATNRPEAVVGATLIRGGLPYPVDTDHDEAWWRQRPSRTLTGQPLDLWYEPTWPNGSVHFDPLPDAADTLELAWRALFSTITLTTTVSLPDGYELALMLTLAEQIAPTFGQQPSPGTMQAARDARAAVFNANTVVPKLVTCDAGMPSGSGARGADLPRFYRGY